jgi:serine/threonine-protein kinase RsbW
MSTVTDQSNSTRIELSIPAQPVLLQLVRLTAGVVAARVDLELDDVEDLRLAVDELCLPLIGPTGHDGRLSVRYSWDDGTIEVSCTLVAGDAPGDATSPSAGLRQELSSQILDALVDEHGETTEDGRAGLWLRMRRSRRPEGAVPTES